MRCFSNQWWAYGSSLNGRHLLVPRRAVERDRLGQRAVRLEVHHRRAMPPSMGLELAEQPPAEPEPARLGGDPHPLDVRRYGALELHRCRSPRARRAGARRARGRAARRARRPRSGCSALDRSRSRSAARAPRSTTRNRTGPWGSPGARRRSRSRRRSGGARRPASRRRGVRAERRPAARGATTRARRSAGRAAPARRDRPLSAGRPGRGRPRRHVRRRSIPRSRAVGAAGSGTPSRARVARARAARRRCPRRSPRAGARRRVGDPARGTPRSALRSSASRHG